MKGLDYDNVTDVGAPAPMAWTSEKGYTISGHRPQAPALLDTKLIFPLSSSTPVTVAAMQTHISWVVMS